MRTPKDYSAYRKIIHVDMDAFYAAVEQRDNPSLRGKPVIISGDPSKRGVVSTCSYEARQFGVHSAMPSRTAYKLCPNGIFVPARFSAYKEVSLQIRDIFRDYTDLIEPLSLDEAYMDVTVNKKNMPYATEIAKEILKRIKKETDLTASAGVSFNKFLAKVASDYRKPAGLTVIKPENAQEFIDNLKIRKFYGVGKVTEQKMLRLNIHTGRDLRQYSLEQMKNLFGKAGSYYYNIVHCRDERPVTPYRERKSVGRERTFQQDIDDMGLITKHLLKLTGHVSEMLKNMETMGKTITLKIKYFNFRSSTRSYTLNSPTNSPEEIYRVISSLLNKTDAGKIKARLLGVSVSNLISAKSEPVL